MIRAAGLALLFAILPVVGQAAVYEYTRDGRVVVRESSGQEARHQAQRSAMGVVAELTPEA